MKRKKIILVGPSATGKNFIREVFIKKGYHIDISCTSRKPRENEVDGKDYRFYTKSKFEKTIEQGGFYEYVKYNDEYYGTLTTSWIFNEIFIMETDGIKHIKPEHRNDCLIIYINTPFDIRLKRMRERGWTDEKISERVRVDQAKFSNFTDYDLEISSYSENEI